MSSASAAVQRVNDVTAAPTPEPAPPQGDPLDLDDLARRLYPRMKPLLQKDLWLDRERAGLLADLHR